MAILRSFKFSLAAIAAAAAAAAAHAEVTVTSSACGDRFSSASKEWPFTGTRELYVMSEARALNGQVLAIATADSWDWWVQATNMNVALPAGTPGFTVGYHYVYDGFSWYSAPSFSLDCRTSWMTVNSAGGHTVRAAAAASIAHGATPAGLQAQAKIVPGIVVGSELDAEFAEQRARANAGIRDAAVSIAQAAAGVRRAEAEFQPRARALGATGLRSDGAVGTATTKQTLNFTPARVEAGELSTWQLVGSKEAGVQTDQGWTGLTRLYRSRNEWVALEELDVVASGGRLVIFKERVNTNVNGNAAALETQQANGSALTTLNFISGTKRIRLMTNAAEASAGPRLLAVARSLY